MTMWLGSKPTKCDICQRPFQDVFYDSTTRDGRWGLICHTCWQVENGRVGTGLAQKYDLATKEKVAG